MFKLQRIGNPLADRSVHLPRALCAIMSEIALRSDGVTVAKACRVVSLQIALSLSVTKQLP